MKQVRLNGRICIFDKDINTCRLYIRYNTFDSYARVMYTSGEHKGKTFARVLLEAPSHLQVDHINGNPLDNRRINLRLVTPQQNSYNKAKQKNTKTPKGVSKHYEGYQARITNRGLTYTLGTYRTVEEAEKAYKDKAEESQKQYALHNRNK